MISWKKGGNYLCIQGKGGDIIQGRIPKPLQNNKGPKKIDVITPKSPILG